jgi:hypothetical protein
MRGAPPTRGGAPRGGRGGALARAGSTSSLNLTDTDATSDTDSDTHSGINGAGSIPLPSHDRSSEHSDDDATSPATSLGNSVDTDDDQKMHNYLTQLLNLSADDAPVQLPASPGAPPIPNRSPPPSPRGPFPTLPARSAWSTSFTKRGPSLQTGGARHSLGSSRSSVIISPSAIVSSSSSDDVSASSSDAQSTPPPQKKKTKEDLRKDILLEIFETEDAYVRDLETMINVCCALGRYCRSLTD